MEEFRKKLQKKAIAAAIICLLAPTILITLQIITKRDVDTFGSAIYGAFGGVMTVAVFNLVRMLSAIKSEEKLKRLYIAEKDERNILIGKQTCTASLLIVVTGIAFAALIASYFNITVSLTLGAVVLFIALVLLGVRIYYNKTM
ncbi:MAG: hypothetical protein J6Y71_11955 [Ruminococcus sp.]|nr:hypothetical protein [Ruminococcus sp.]